MFKKVLMAATLAASAAVPAQALVVTTQLGSPATFAAPAIPSSTVINFNTSTLPAGFTATYTNAILKTGDSSTGAEPAFSDGSQYLSVLSGGSATIQSTSGFDIVSFFLGSIDGYNSVQVLSATGAVLATYTGADFTQPADGNQDIPSTNRRVTITRQAGDAAIGGIRFTSSLNSAEVDNLVFAVPEPTTWAMMIFGFGAIGMAMRARRRRENAVLA